MINLYSLLIWVMHFSRGMACHSSTQFDAWEEVLDAWSTLTIGDQNLHSHVWNVGKPNGYTRLYCKHLFLAFLYGLTSLMEMNASVSNYTMALSYTENLHPNGTKKYYRKISVWASRPLHGVHRDMIPCCYLGYGLLVSIIWNELYSH